jgi:membrane protease YdiL (CAAX protease family)
MDPGPFIQESSSPISAQPPAVATAAPAREVLLRRFELLLLLGVSIGPSLVSAFFVHFLYGNKLPVPSVAWYISYGLTNGVIHQAGGLALLCYILFRQGRSLRDIGFSFRWIDIPVAIALWILSWLAATACHLYVNLIYNVATGRQVQQWDGAAAMLGTHVSVMVVVFLVVNAFYEELIVRAYLMSEVLAGRHSALVAGVVSVCVQALYHIYQGVPNMIALAGLFTVYAIYYGATRRILPVILAHLFVDAASATALFIRHH